MALERSPTITLAVALFVAKFGTMLVADTVAVSAIFVPNAVPAFTCRTKVKLAVPLTARLAIVQVIVPVPPTGGTVPQAQPAGGVIDWKVVFGGVFCVKLTVVAAAGPLLVTLCVYVTLLPDTTESGEPEFVATRSACVASATTSFAVALLFTAFGSLVEELTLAV